MGIPFLSTHALYPIPRPPGVFRRLIATNARLSKRFISRVSGQKNVTRYSNRNGIGRGFPAVAASYKRILRLPAASVAQVCRIFSEAKSVPSQYVARGAG